MLYFHMWSLFLFYLRIVMRKHDVNYSHLYSSNYDSE